MKIFQKIKRLYNKIINYHSSNIKTNSSLDNISQAAGASSKRNVAAEYICYFAAILLLFNTSIPIRNQNINIQQYTTKNNIILQKDIFLPKINNRFHTIEKGENLTTIAKKYVSLESTEKEVRGKILEIQKLSNLAPNNNNDYLIVSNNKLQPGNDGLIDKVYPGQKLIVESKKIYNKEKEIKCELTKDIEKDYRNNSNLKEIIEKEKETYEDSKIIPPNEPFNFEYDFVINLYNSNKESSTIIKKFNQKNKNYPVLESTILNYIKQGIQEGVAHRTRFSKKYAKKLNLDNFITNMIKENKKYNEIKTYVNSNGMNISNSTIYRIKKELT